MKESSFQPGAAYKLNESIDVAQGGIVSKQFLKKETGNITLFAFDAGQGLSEHTAPFDAVVHVLEGEAEVTIDGNTSTVSTGEAIIMPANIPHALHASVAFKMSLIMIKDPA